MDQAELKIDTARLRLRPLTRNDLSELHCLWTEPEVRKYLWDDKIIPLEQTASIIATSQNYFQTKGFGLWIAVDKLEEKFAGFGGFWFFHQPPTLELLFGIAPGYWHRGLATEVAEALLEYGFERLRWPRIEASTDADNRASARVLEIAGMKFWKREITQEGDLLYYALDRVVFAAVHTNL